jgi:hypothetical protein
LEGLLGLKWRGRYCVCLGGGGGKDNSCTRRKDKGLSLVDIPSFYFPWPWLMIVLYYCKWKFKNNKCAESTGFFKFDCHFVMQFSLEHRVQFSE